jgi:hypothetical protein
VTRRFIFIPTSFLDYRHLRRWIVLAGTELFTVYLEACAALDKWEFLHGNARTVGTVELGAVNAHDMWDYASKVYKEATKVHNLLFKQW